MSAAIDPDDDEFGPVVYDIQLKACPFCGSTSIDPEGWMSGWCQCPDAAAHAIMKCEKRTGPSCDGCGATAESVEAWEARAQ